MKSPTKKTVSYDNLGNSCLEITGRPGVCVGAFFCNMEFMADSFLSHHKKAEIGICFMMLVFVSWRKLLSYVVTSQTQRQNLF